MDDLAFYNRVLSSSEIANSWCVNIIVLLLSIILLCITNFDLIWFDLICIVLYCIVLYYFVVLFCCIVLYCIVLYYIIWYDIIRYCIILHSMIIYYIVYTLHDIIWYYTILYDNVLIRVTWYVSHHTILWFKNIASCYKKLILLHYIVCWIIILNDCRIISTYYTLLMIIFMCVLSHVVLVHSLKT